MKSVFLFLLALPVAAQGAWIVKSDFQLQLTEGLFDQIIGDFWSSLQGKQEIPIADFTVTPQGIPVHITGIKAEVNYSFPLPKRVDERTREWDLESENLSAKLTVASVSANTVKVIEENGIIIRIPIVAECKNIVLSLPPGLTKVSARIKAEVADNQVKLSLPRYAADWQQGAWRVDSMQCSGIDGIDNVIKAAALEALSSFQNFDAEVHTALTDNFDKWSKDASLLLLSERELPTSKDYLKVYYEPRSAVEASGGLLLGGEMRFEYPYVSPDQTIEQEYRLDAGASAKGAANATVPQLQLPFGTLRALMMGEYFSGKLEHSLWSTEIPAFTDFMQSRWKQFWAWPELMRYPKDAKFAFQFVPMGPPAFDKEKAIAGNSISGELNLPLAMRMFAPVNGKLRPMTEFRTLMAGTTKLKLLKGGKIEMQITAKSNPVTYTWAQKYVTDFNPTKRVAVDTIAEGVRDSLNKEGFVMEIPSITVGKSLQLVPEKWNLENGKNLRLDFTTKK